MNKNKSLNVQDAEQKVAEDKTKRLKSFSNVDLLKHCQNEKMTDAAMKEIFLRYSKNSKNLTATELISLLFDILRSCDLAPVVPESAIHDVLSEFALNVEHEQSQTPIKYLADTIQKSFCVPMAELSSKAALLSFFIKPEWAAENCDRGIPRKEDFSGVEAELKNFFGGDDGFIAQTNLFFLEPHSRVDVLLVVGDEDRLRDVEEMARSDEGLFLMDHKTTYSKYDQQVLPRLRKTAQKQLTGLAANGILGLHGAYKGANQMASDWELQQKAEKARKSIYDVFQNVDEKTGISGIARSISESAKSLGEEANRRASKVDSDMGISEKIGSIKGDMSRHVAKLSENESVKSGLNFITGIFSSAKEKIEGFTEETMDIVGSELQETKRPSDKDDGAKVEHLGKDREGSDVAENEISFTAEEMDRKSRE